MRRKSTIMTAELLLNLKSLLGTPRGTQATLDSDAVSEVFGDNDDLSYKNAWSWLVRNKFVTKAGDRYIINY